MSLRKVYAMILIAKRINQCTVLLAVAISPFQGVGGYWPFRSILNN